MERMYIQSPLNYTGGKFRLLPQILPHFPADMDSFVDLFCGGLNVGLNVSARRVIFRDVSPQLLDLYNTFAQMEPEAVLGRIDGIIAAYGLSDSSKYGYAHYGTDSSSGLAAYNRAAFLRLREAYNRGDTKDPLTLFVLILYAFNNQIRFNKSGVFNLPVGKRDFNNKMRRKLNAFLSRLQTGDYSFTCQDFRLFDPRGLTEQSLVYCDPPYLRACAPYNERGGWREADESALLAFLDRLDRQNIKFALSNLLCDRGGEPTMLSRWAKRYRVLPLNHDYANANYQKRDRSRGAGEVLVLNF